MPIHKVKSGYKFGTKGKLYKGKAAHKKALKQAAAIHIREAQARGSKYR